MSTRAQRRAARRNGKKSRGPVTPEGKARSAANSTRHGLTSPGRAARGVCLHNEDSAEFNLLYESLVAEHLPATSTEHLIVHEMATARWLLQRSWIMASSLIDNKVDAMRDKIAQEYESTDEATRTALAFDELTATRPALALLQRYQTSHSRQFDRCLRRLNSLRATRNNEFPIEPDSEKYLAQRRPEETRNDRQFPDQQPASAAQPAQADPEQRRRQQQPASVISIERPSEMDGICLPARSEDPEPEPGTSPGLPRAA